jgi:hypothetical protein
LRALRAEPDTERRRALFKSKGKTIGALEKAFAATITAQGPDAIAIYTPLQNQVVGAVINEALNLCGLRVAT